MKIEYVVMVGNAFGESSLFRGLRIDNNFPTEEAAEEAIETYFERVDLRWHGLQPSDFLFVLKIFKSIR